MPVQINEMVIRTHVNEAPEKVAPPATAADQQEGGDKEAILKECREMILELLNRKNER